MVFPRSIFHAGGNTRTFLRSEKKIPTMMSLSSFYLDNFTVASYDQCAQATPYNALQFENKVN